ncbi:hypothetical protein [Amycolatopsis sp. cmx-4-61]|uniref:hypothetical protein n=1 Tax=Amycolatopsis sp. cmx-4-61 TaxID=2790937 RepID=UPI003979A50A
MELRDEDGALVATVADDAHGTRRLGIQRRVAAFDGTTKIISSPGGPTAIRADIPAGLRDGLT